MFNPFICGSFHHQEDDEIDSFSPCSTPKRSKRTNSYKNKETKNPYADRGLDKFHTLLAELDEKKQKIFTQKGAEDISLVRFVISNDNQIKPVVVKLKEKKQSQSPANNFREKNVIITPDELGPFSDNHSTESSNPGTEIPRSEQGIEKRVKNNFCNYNLNWAKLKDLKQPVVYLPVIVILVLVLLAIYGRSFAIMCTSIGWYLIPLMKGTSSNESRNGKRKKEYRRRLSEKTVVYEGSSSPTSVISGPTDMSPRKYGHRRSF